MATVSLDSQPATSAYQAALDYLYGRVNYERQAMAPYREVNFRLDRMRELLARLGSPHDGQQIVHIAGTKGKGSTATLIAAMLTNSGKRTALYTSPHLHHVEERFAVDGRPCSQHELADLVALVRPVVEQLDQEETAAGRTGPTYFEITTAMAFLHFARQKVDATVLEVGLGGRLDSTNVCQPLVSVITSISFDHMEQLGDTLAKIAGEKAGIIKPGVPVVSGVTNDEPRSVIRAVAAANGCTLAELDRDFTVQYRTVPSLSDGSEFGQLDFRQTGPSVAWELLDAQLGMIGKHQARNAAVALATICELRNLGWQISDEAIRQALASVRCAARVELISRKPTVVVDAAHNVAAVDALLAALDESFPASRRVLLFATTRGKEYREMLARLVPRFDKVILTRYRNNPRSVSTEELVEAIEPQFADRVVVCATPDVAWQTARQLADRDTLLCVTGSFFIAAEVRTLVAGGDETVVRL
jgi:dihydrofolate synthase/folylpolyglutamate synthase